MESVIAQFCLSEERQTGQREKEGKWEPERPRQSQGETEMGNEKDRAVIIIAEFAFRMQTD